MSENSVLLPHSRFLAGFIIIMLAVAFGIALSTNNVILADQQYRLIEEFPGISFNAPVAFDIYRNNSYVVEQDGTIQMITPKGNKLLALDISAQVESGGEKGLLGIAFHPNYPLVYLDYTAPNPLHTVISEFKVNSDGTINASSERILLTVNQPYGNHNGGQLAFGPDGMLYIAMGDGGAAGDPHNHAQNPKTLLGAILRIDPTGPCNGMPYGIPADNPFVGNTDGFREEIYAFGLRNPWRFSFDGDKLWAGDVGQNLYEEIDIVIRGGNYGWSGKEGFECYNSAICSNSSYIDPIHAYGRGDGGTVIGGYVYRGTNMTGLVGKYIYGDFISGKIWSLQEDGTNELILETSFRISTFGLTADHEILVFDYSGKIYRMVHSL